MEIRLFCQLDRPGVEIATHFTQGIRNAVKVRKARRFGALRSPGLGQLLNVGQA